MKLIGQYTHKRRDLGMFSLVAMLLALTATTGSCQMYQSAVTSGSVTEEEHRLVDHAIKAAIALDSDVAIWCERRNVTAEATYSLRALVEGKHGPVVNTPLAVAPVEKIARDTICFDASSTALEMASTVILQNISKRLERGREELSVKRVLDCFDPMLVRRGKKKFMTLPGAADPDQIALLNIELARRMKNVRGVLFGGQEGGYCLLFRLNGLWAVISYGQVPSRNSGGAP